MAGGNSGGMNIYQKMLEATNKINKVAKNLNVGMGKSQYKAVGEADVLEAVKPVEIELGIYSFPLSRRVIETNVFTTTSEYDGKTTEKTNLFMRLETIYRFINTEKPDEYIDITTYGDGVDPQDKAPGKAMTYADKYALLKAYKVETGDDPDQKASENMKPKGEQKKFDKSADTPQEAQEEIDKIKGRKINKVQLDSINAELDRTGIKALQIAKQYNVAALSELTFEQWHEIMTRFEKTPTKKKTELPLQ
jgi:hypothetical protein